MSFPSSNHWSLLPWDYNSTLDQANSYIQHQPRNPSQTASYPPPPPQPPSASSAYPRLPLPAYTHPRHHSTASHSQLQQRSTPSASLHAALREGADFLPRPSILPHLPPLSRINSTPARQSSFGYIPNHFFYSPPQSPQEPDPPQHPINQDPAHNFAPLSSAQDYAGPSFTNQSLGPSVINPLARPPSANQSTPHLDPRNLAGAFRSGQSQYLSHDNSEQSHVKQEDSNVMAPSASASATATSRKRSRPSFSGSPPSATKRRLNPAPIELDDSDEDEIEELGPDNDILAKEREALVSKQREESSKVNRIGELNCMICLEHFTNMTATHCGHIFCHECLTQALTASQRSSDHNYGTCPACRKPIKPKGKTQIIPLALMKAKKKR